MDHEVQCADKLSFLLLPSDVFGFPFSGLQRLWDLCLCPTVSPIIKSAEHTPLSPARWYGRVFAPTFPLWSNPSLGVQPVASIVSVGSEGRAAPCWAKLFQLRSSLNQHFAIVEYLKLLFFSVKVGWMSWEWHPDIVLSLPWVWGHLCPASTAHWRALFYILARLRSFLFLLSERSCLTLLFFLNFISFSSKSIEHLFAACPENRIQ